MPVESTTARESQSKLQIIPPLFYWGALLLIAAAALYCAAIGFFLFRLALLKWLPVISLEEDIIWLSALLACLGLILVVSDLVLLLPRKRRTERRPEGVPIRLSGFTVGLTAYNDEESIYDAVREFLSHPLVIRVIVVSNGSTDRTEERAREAGAIVVCENNPGYGWCVWRCLRECLKFEDSEYVVLCEGDQTFRAFDLEQFVAYMPHADIVNGTRIVEQLRAYSTQLSTFMYYGNFFTGKLLELKHLGKGTFTDVGTTYKVIERDALVWLLPHLEPRVNLEFNAHFMDTALRRNFTMVECPITFHPRVGTSKGGNVNNLRALSVGLRMIAGLTFGWRWIRKSKCKPHEG